MGLRVVSVLIHQHGLSVLIHQHGLRVDPPARSSVLIHQHGLRLCRAREARRSGSAAFGPDKRRVYANFKPVLVVGCGVGRDCDFSPFTRGKPGKPRVDNRRVISGILHVLKTGCRWRDVPSDYGPATTIYNRQQMVAARAVTAPVPTGRRLWWRSSGTEPRQLSRAGTGETATSLLPTGSGTATKTIGIVRVARWAASAAGRVIAIRTWTLSSASSTARLANRFGCSAGKRFSRAMF